MQRNDVQAQRSYGEAYSSFVSEKALTRLLLVDAPGLLRLNQTNGSYEATPRAVELLSLSSDQGQISDLGYVFDGYQHAENENTSTLVFRNISGRIVRLRLLHAFDAEPVFSVEDVTAIFDLELAYAREGRDVRGLFGKAPYGIYRSTLQGVPLRCNPAMLRINGFETEQDLFNTLTDTGKGWYVDPNQRPRFIEALKRDGIVVDCISEVRVHNRKETIWVSETAWLFKDPELGIEIIEGTVIDATARVEQELALRQSASTDWLTGLANRSAFHAHIDAALANRAEGQTIAVFLIDLDRFKDVNDVFGHARGDMLLTQVANRLKEHAPEQAFLARLGGDEFGIIIACNENCDSAKQLGDALCLEIAKSFKLEGSEHVVGASMGLATFPQDAETAIDLLKAADLALYKSKQLGRCALEIYDPALANDKRKQALIIHDLAGADRRGELELHYQPIVDAAAGKVVGLEALMRWRHPKRGLVSPVEFIPVAEKAGFMVAFGAWAIDQACMHAAAIPPDMHIAVNVSAVQFYSADLPQIVAAALDRHGIHAARLELEVTESFLLINEALTQQVLQALKALGVRIVLDDFGTGYSSLSYLQRFQFDKVKIDKSFVRSLKSNAVNSAIVRAVLSIGRDLGLDVVAEGIETETERNDLLDEGCPFFQGYLYGKPRPLQDVAADLNAERLKDLLPEPVLDMGDRRSA